LSGDKKKNGVSREGGDSDEAEEEKKIRSTYTPHTGLAKKGEAAKGREQTRMDES
jgi:hypothetical protein